jgi:hypothetical protein
VKSRNLKMVLMLQAVGLAAAVLTASPHARADAVAYLINVTVRPGYNFANADDALAYGRGICDKIAAGQTYADVVDSAKSDFASPDEYQASYLVVQAVNELCPPLIWQLRNSAAENRSPI